MKGIEFQRSDKNSRPWIDLGQFVANRDLLQEFGLVRMQRFTVVPLSWHKPFLTLAVPGKGCGRRSRSGPTVNPVSLSVTSWS